MHAYIHTQIQIPAKSATVTFMQLPLRILHSSFPITSQPNIVAGSDIRFNKFKFLLISAVVKLDIYGKELNFFQFHHLRILKGSFDLKHLNATPF